MCLSVYVPGLRSNMQSDTERFTIFAKNNTNFSLSPGDVSSVDPDQTPCCVTSVLKDYGARHATQTHTSQCFETVRKMVYVLYL